MSLKPFNFGIVTKRVLPVRSLRNSTAQQLEFNKVLELLSWGAKENLFEEISVADDDILRWSPELSDDYKDKGSKLYSRVAEMKSKLDASEIGVHAVVCDLTSSSVFAHGAFTNNDSKVRELAKKKAERALEIGRALNASLFIYESDSDGFDSPFTVIWQDAWKRLAAGLDGISQYANSQRMTNYRGGCIAPRQSAAYMYGFINTPSDALNIIQSLLKDRNFWGIVPATSQLSAQGWEKAPATLANIAGARRLASIRIGGGTDRPYHRAPHPILGTGNLAETVQMFWVLDRLGWKGAVEYDNVASVSDAKCTNDETTCKQFIANCANALTVALQAAEKVKSDEMAVLTPSEADLMAATVLASLDVDNVIFRTIKKLPPAFETPQHQEQRQQSNGQQKQQSNGQQKQQNQTRQQRQGGDQKPPKPQQPVEPAKAPEAEAPAQETPVLEAKPAERDVESTPDKAVGSQVEDPAIPVPANSDPASILHLAPKAAPAPIADAAPAEPAPVEPAAEDLPVAEAPEEPVEAEEGDEASEMPAVPAVSAIEKARAAEKSRRGRSRRSVAQAAQEELPPPAPVLEDSDVPAAEDELPLILPADKPAQRKAGTRPRKSSSSGKSSGKSSGGARRSPRKKSSDGGKVQE